VRLLYFAWLRTRIGVAEEDIPKPAAIETVRDLLASLPERSAGHAAALADPRIIRVAVNHEHVGLDHVIGESDEIALFPPVTGG